MKDSPGGPQGAPDVEVLLERVHEIATELRGALGVLRVTVRIDNSELGLTVQLPCAETVSGDGKTLAGDGSIDQWSTATVRWMLAHRRALVQNAFRGDPLPPAELIEAYGVNAQILEPVTIRDEMTGWLSVHSGVERQWSEDDIYLCGRARGQVEELLMESVSE